MIIIICITLLNSFCNSIELIPPFTKPDINDNPRDCDDIQTTTTSTTKFTFPKGAFNQTRLDEIIEHALSVHSVEKYYYTPEKYTTTPTTRVPYPAEGAFFNFTVDLYETILKKFQPKRISNYFSILGSKLKISLTRRRWCGPFLKLFMKLLARKAKLLSRYGVSRIKEAVSGMVNDTLDAKPKRIAFFKAMNSLFTIRYVIKLNAYTYYLRAYGQRFEGSRILKRETEKLMNLIFYIIYKQKDDVRDDVIMKLMLAYEEYYSK